MGRRSALVTLMLLLPVLKAGAASVLEFDRWMQQIDRHSQSILRAIAAQNRDQASADAQALADLYRRMEQFYEQRGGADDAVLASYVGRDHADSALQALGQDDFTRAAAEAAQLARDCRSCHLQFKPIRN
jgi:cytochrome c556